MSLNDVMHFLMSSKQEKSDLVFTILLPLISGIVIILIVKPGWIISTNVITLCLLSFSAILPVWGINVIVWSLIDQKILNETFLHMVSFLTIPEESKSLLKKTINEISMPKSFFGCDIARRSSSMMTAICTYLTATISYFVRPSLPSIYLCVVLTSLVLSVSFAVFIVKIVIPRQDKEKLNRIWEEVKAEFRSRGELRAHVKERIERVERIIAAQKERGPSGQSITSAR